MPTPRLSTPVTRPVRNAENPRVHVFLSSSDVHLMYQLKKNHEEILELATEMVGRAAGYLSDVEFSPMDATRTDREYLYRILESVINAGATTVNIPDTVGYTTPRGVLRAHLPASSTTSPTSIRRW